MRRRCFLASIPLKALTASGRRRVFYVNSYHPGYGSSDQVQAALLERFRAEGVDVEHLYLGAKRNPAAAGSNAAAALTAIRSFQPGVVIVSDDDAVKHLVVPHLRRGPLPVVFCGVNWSSVQYDLPRQFVTGMHEVVPIVQAIETVRAVVPHIWRFATLSEDSVSERANQVHLEPRYRGLGLRSESVLVADFDAWKRAFIQLNQTADLIYLPTNGAILGWEDGQAEAHVLHHAARPIITCDDFMMRFCALGLTKVAGVQGEGAAAQALVILAGASPAAIPLAENRRSRCFFTPLSPTARASSSVRRGSPAAKSPLAALARKGKGGPLAGAAFVACGSGWIYPVFTSRS